MKKHFLTGLLVLLPLAITIWIVLSICNVLTDPFIHFVKSWLSHFPLKSTFLFMTGEQLLNLASRLLILVGIFFSTILLGMLAQTLFMHQLFKLGNYILHHIPLVNKIYKLSQEIIKPFFSSQSQSFKKVVLVPFPSQESYCLGFLTEKSPAYCKTEEGESLLSIFIPTSPNPMSGYLVMYKPEQVRELSMSTEDAVKFIISCGVIYPHIPQERENSET